MSRNKMLEIALLLVGSCGFSMWSANADQLNEMLTNRDADLTASMKIVETMSGRSVCDPRVEPNCVPVIPPKAPPGCTECKEAWLLDLNRSKVVDGNVVLGEDSIGPFNPNESLVKPDYESIRNNLNDYFGESSARRLKWSGSVPSPIYGTGGG